jgi:hypothetical protein
MPSFFSPKHTSSFLDVDKLFFISSLPRHFLLFKKKAGKEASRFERDFLFL